MRIPLVRGSDGRKIKFVNAYNIHHDNVTFTALVNLMDMARSISASCCRSAAASSCGEKSKGPSQTRSRTYWMPLLLSCQILHFPRELGPFCLLTRPLVPIKKA